MFLKPKVTEIKKQKTFLLGVGAQKAGTTWLHSYFGDHHDCFTGPIKEYHIFDAAYQPELFGGTQVRHLKNASAFLAEKAEDAYSKTPKIDKKLYLVLNRILMRLEPACYLDNFRRQMREDPRKKLFSDITPSYSGLNKSVFKEIRSLFVDTEFDLKIVFLMRDPIDRLFSAMKMIDRKVMENNGVLKINAAERFKKQYATKDNEVRTRYENTIRNLEAVFPRENIHYEFYETLFQEDSIKKLCAFLEIDYIKPDFGRQINASPSKFLPNDEDVIEARKFYGKTYDFCMKRFGAEHIKNIWAYA